MVYFGFMLPCSVATRERKLCEEWKYLQDCHCLRVQEVTCFDCAISSAESAAFEVAFDFFHQCAAFIKKIPYSSVMLKKKKKKREREKKIFLTH